MVRISVSRWLCRVMAVFAAAIFCTDSANATIISYQFGTGDSTGSPATSFDSNLTASVFSDGDGTTFYSAGSGNVAPSAEKCYSEIALLSSEYWGTNSFFEFTLTANPGYELTLSQLSFDYDKDQLTGGGAKPAITLDLRSSLDAYATTLGTVVDNGNGVAGRYETSLISLSSVVDSATFRIYLARSNENFGSSGLVHIDNVNVEGSVSLAPEQASFLAPEPASFWVWGGIGIAGLFAAWRRKRSQAGKLAA